MFQILHNKKKVGAHDDVLGFISLLPFRICSYVDNWLEIIYTLWTWFLNELGFLFRRDLPKKLVEEAQVLSPNEKYKEIGKPLL